MKIARFVFAMIGCGALALRPGFAADTPNHPSEPPRPESRPQTGSDRMPDDKLPNRPQGQGERNEGKNSAGKQGESRPSSGSGQTDAKPVPFSHRPNQHPRGREPNHRDNPGQRPVASAHTKTMPAKAADTRPTSLGNPTNSLKDRGHGKNIDNARRPTLVSAAAVPSVGLSLNPGRNPRASPVAIGGLPNPNTKNTAVIWGTGMRHRP